MNQLIEGLITGGMACPNCKNDKWEPVDFARIKPAGMAICTDCGMVSYPNKWKTTEEIKKHYRGSYRPPPTHNNCFSGERKNHFHHAFLDSLFKEWVAKGITKPKILEVGAAFGFALNWFKTLFPEAEIYGTELTTSFRRNAHHEFGINLTEEIDTSIKYDLIMSYKVLEHQLSPELEMEKYREILAEDGRFYISVPTWFNSLYNFGLNGFDLEYYYDPNHVNVWTTKMFEGMLANAGFEILKENQIIYASTYLCKVNRDLIGSPVYKNKPEEIKQAMGAIKVAYMAFLDGNYAEARKIAPDYPQAWISDMEMNRKEMATIGWPAFKEKWVDAFIKACPNSPDAFITATDFAMRAEQFKDALDYCEKALVAKPMNPVSLHAMCMIMREMAMKAKDPKEKMHYWLEAGSVARHLRNVSTQHWREATDLIYLFNSKVPFKGEAIAKPQAQPEGQA